MEDLKKHYEIMNSCNAYLKSLPVRKMPSESTIKQYASDLRRMVKSNSDPLSISVNKKTYYKYRAAWCCIYELKAQETVAKASKEKDNIKKIALIKKLDYYVLCLKKYPPDTAKQNVSDVNYVSAWKQAEKPKTASKSKKYQVSKMPTQWQERYFNYLKSIDSKFLDAICVLSCAGVRPAELQKGVKLKKEGDSIRFIIDSVKTHDGKYGQEQRSFLINAETVEFQHLLKKLNDGEELIIRIESAKNLGDRMRSYSKDVFGVRMNHYVSPYTYRHNFAGLAKAIFSDDDKVAQILGHCNDLSQIYYCNRKKSAGSFKIEDVKGSRSVKHVVKYNLDMILDDRSSLRL